MTTFWTQHALQFIEKEKDKPFFLYLCFNGPYGLGPGQLKDRERAPHWQDYQNTDLPSFRGHIPAALPQEWIPTLE